jgi:glycosyltransferase
MSNFSIITIVKNSKENIKKTIESVLCQKYSNYEYIILDGCSIDGTTKIIKDTIKNSKKVKYLRIKDEGLYDALNKCILLCKNKYVGILHSGDLYKNQYVLKTVSKKVNSNLDFISGNILYYNKNFKIFRKWNIKYNMHTLFNFIRIPHTSLFLKKKIFNEIGLFNKNYKISADFDFIIRMLFKKRYKYSHLNEFIVLMKYGGISSNKNFILKMKEDIKILYEHFGIRCLALYFMKLLIKVKGFQFYYK